MPHSADPSNPDAQTPADKRYAKVCDSLSEVGAKDWDLCANAKDQSLGAHAGNPFTRYAFLDALERSGSATAETGWAPYHLALYDEHDAICGVVPLYLKSHSQGEYVFDHAWADAYHRAGRSYYPKFQISVPFTPATGRRLLTPPASDTTTTERQLMAALIDVTGQLDVPSLHLTFLPKDQWQRLGDMGLLQRTDQQFHWQNDGYDTFDNFLAALASRKRKNLRKERQAALDNDIDIEWLTGSDIKEHHWDAFYGFYQDTGSRKWGRPYLTRDFFSMVGESIPNQTLLIMCKRNDRYIAGALNFMGEDCLYGRHWGCTEHHPFLHFETCYYQAIEFAITNKIGRVEAGAQGEHKLARGYTPTLTYSAHYITDPQFRAAIADYLERERRHVDVHNDILSDHTPFRQDTTDTST